MNDIIIPQKRASAPFCFLAYFFRFQSTNNGLARKIDEYAPDRTPTINASTNDRVVTPPNRKIASNTNVVVNEVLIERAKLCTTLLFTNSSNDASL